jgi:hypothetical protein
MEKGVIVVIDVDTLMNIIPLDDSTNKLAKDIVQENDVEKVQNLVHLFNLNQSKKNVLRILKLNNLLDKVQDQMIERFEKKPGEFSNADLLNYMQVAQSAIDRANKSLNLVDETPSITMNQVNVNISEDPVLNRESREKVTEAIAAIMKKLNMQEQSEDEIIVEQDTLLKEEE